MFPTSFSHGVIPRVPPKSLRPATALLTLQHLPPDELDRVVAAWLASLQIQEVRLFERHGRSATYEGCLSGKTGPIPVRVRVLQRLHRLQVHHIESFLGHLVRSGVPIGILITTGDCSWAAALAARTPRVPYLRLCTGEEWAAELVEQHLLGTSPPIYCDLTERGRLRRSSRRPTPEPDPKW